MSEPKQPERELGCNTVVLLTDVLIEEELEAWRNDYRLAGKDFDDFALGLRAGIAAACRINKSLPCFCGHHIGNVDGR